MLHRRAQRDDTSRMHAHTSMQNALCEHARDVEWAKNKNPNRSS